MHGCMVIAYQSNAVTRRDVQCGCKWIISSHCVKSSQKIANNKTHI